MTRQLVLQMMDRTENNQTTPGLLTKLMQKLEADLDGPDPLTRDRAMDKIIKLMPFVIAKEKGPAVQLNVQNNMNGPQITTGKSTSLAVSTIQDYLKNREHRTLELQRPQIQDAEIVGEESEEGEEGEE